ncbi:MAG TPA: acetylornithine deacetylase [Casimicrobiaceae bacterium]|nr:acetylornithine deacetylase [Casimicrobiaceae bacterium]
MNAPAVAREVAGRTPIERPEDLVGYDLIRRLVSFPTVSRDSNLELIEWVRAYAESHGAATALTYNDDRRKANLWITFPARDGNAVTGGVVLSGHTDVVPVDGQPWDSDPFTVTHKDGRLYGRGVADMKSFSAIGLAFVPRFLARGLRKPLHFALSYDEEVGCIGVRRLIADVVAQGIHPMGCIVGEPTGMELVVAHKGKMSWRCRVRGREAHSSLTPRGVNAVQIACEIVAYIARRAREFRDGTVQDKAYDVPYTTAHVGIIRGGTALNIVPRDCSFEFELRHLPLDDPEVFFADVQAFAHRFVPEMQRVDPSTYVEFDHLSTLPGFDTSHDSEVIALGRACNGTHSFGKVSFGSEAALFHDAAVPAVLCGPGHIEQAHQPNEWIGLDQLVRCEAFMERLGDRICAS